MSIPPPPAELANLAQALGAEALFALIDAHGGTRLFIPRSPAPDSDLVAAVGMEGAQALAAEWGGNYLKVPLARAWIARVLSARGLSQAAIARHLRTTENTVRLMLQGQAEPSPSAARDSRQMGLPI